MEVLEHAGMRIVVDSHRHRLAANVIELRRVSA
jgi:hypothetical protein